MTKKLRFFICSLQVGGTERHLVQILPALAQQYGWKIKVILSSNNMTLAEPLLDAGITIFTPPALNCLEKLPKSLERILRIIINLLRFGKEFIQDRHTITNFFLPEPYIIATLAALLTLSPVTRIMSRRSLNDYQKRRPILGFLEKRIHHFTDFFFGNSQAVVRQLCDEGIPKKKIKLIYNGTEIKPYLTKDEAVDDIRAKLDIPKDAWVMVMVANLIPYKGHEDLLNALFLSKSALSSKPWYMLCIGNDTSHIQDFLEKKANLLEMKKNLYWLNGIKNVMPYLKTSNVGILSSHEEGFSNAIVEGMLAGLPMIVTDVGGNKEAVLHKENGIVVPCKSPKDLSEAIIYLYNNPNIAQTMGKSSYERAINNFSLQRCVDEYNHFYESIS